MRSQGGPRESQTDQGSYTPGEVEKGVQEGSTRVSRWTERVGIKTRYKRKSWDLSLKVDG